MQHDGLGLSMTHKGESPILRPSETEFLSPHLTEEKVAWLPLGSLKDGSGGPDIPKYSVGIVAKVRVPEKKAAFVLEAMTDRPTYLSGDSAIIRAEVSKRASLAIFCLRGDDLIEMLYPFEPARERLSFGPGEIFLFPPAKSGLDLEIRTLEGHKRDTEAFMVVAVAAEEGKPFQFSDFFAIKKVYKLTQFFNIYCNFAEKAVEKILPYEVRAREEN